MSDGITLKVEERDALYEYVLSHLTGLDDLRTAFEEEDFGLASRLAIEFGDELRLMEDIGWGHPTVDGPITITMPAEQRQRLFTWLRSGVASLRRDQEREEAERENEARDHLDRATHIAAACDRVLGSTNGR